MKILWVCNVTIPEIAEAMGKNVPNICGWITGFANAIKNNSKIDLHICFPILGAKEISKGIVGRIKYYSFSQPKVLGFLPAEDPLHVSKLMKMHIQKIIQIVDPDILHVFGTEYPHSLVALETFGKPEQAVINIQGLTSFYWMHYNMGMPYEQIKRFCISNLVRGNLYQQERKLFNRGKFEIEAIKKSGHVIGRTDWDEACTTQINPNIKYHFCNETLRDSFYSGTWDYEKCEKFSIFMSQGTTPIKGLQFMLRAMPEILRVYPDAHLYIANNNIIDTSTIKNRLKMSSFAKYINRLIREKHLKQCVTFTGKLAEDEMKERFLRCNVFVLPSTIENSPNSLGEAMILGVPCVSSDVGGVKNLLKHEIEGYVYQADAPYMLSYYVKQMFNMGEDVERLGQAAKSHSSRTHDRETNANRLIQIYGEIVDVE